MRAGSVFARLRPPAEGLPGSLPSELRAAGRVVVTLRALYAGGGSRAEETVDLVPGGPHPLLDLAALRGVAAKTAVAPLAPPLRREACSTP